MYRFSWFCLAPIFSFLLTSGILVNVVYNGLRHRIQRAFFALCLVLLLWSFGSIFEIAGVIVEAKLIWLYFEYACVVLVPVLFLYLAKVTSDTEQIQRLFPDWIFGALLGIEFLFFAWILSDVAGTWFFIEPHLVYGSGVIGLVFTSRWPLAFMVSFHYVQLAAGLAIYVYEWRRGRNRLFRYQMGMMTLGSIIPMSANFILFIVGMWKPIPIRITPSLFAFSMLVFAVSISKYKYLRILPIKRRQILDSLQSGILVLDNNLHLVEINPASRKFLKISSDPVVGESLDNLITNRSALAFGKDDMDTLLESLNQLRTGEGGAFELMFEALDSQLNRRKFFQLSVSLIQSFFETDELAGFLIQITDVTEERQGHLQREAILALSAAINQSDTVEGLCKTVTRNISVIMDMPIVSIWIYDEAHRQLRMISQTGLMDELIEKIRLQKLSSDNRGVAARTAILRQVIVLEDAAESPLLAFAKEETIKNKSKTLISTPLEVGENLVGVLQVVSRVVRELSENDIRVMRILAGLLSTAISRLQLIDELKKKTVYLQIQTDKAQEAVKLKSQFMSNISHQLRTPMNSIIGFTKILQAGNYGKLPEEFAEPLSIIKSSGELLLKMINEVLDLSRLESGNVVLNKQVLDCRDLVEETVERIRPMAMEKGLDLVATAQENVFCLMDSYRITQVLGNLLENAIKFTDHGAIRVSVDESDEVVVFKVADTGIGIAEQDVENIFEAFTQVNPKPEHFGTGLGLAIAKELVYMHGGSMWVESKIGKGSIFYFSLPKM